MRNQILTSSGDYVDRNESGFYLTTAPAFQVNPHFTYDVWQLLPLLALLFAAIVLCLKAVLPEARRALPKGDEFRKLMRFFDDDQLARQVALLNVTNALAAAAFENRAKEVHQIVRDTMRKLDEKATAILGFVGSGTGLVALAVGTEKVQRPEVTPLLVFAASALFAVLVCALMVLVPRRLGLVNVRRICEGDLWRSNAGETRIAAIIGWEYLVANNYIGQVNRTKVLWLWLAQIFFVLGVAAVVVNSLVLPKTSPSSPSPAALKCTTAPTSINCSLGSEKG